MNLINVDFAAKDRRARLQQGGFNWPFAAFWSLYIAAFAVGVYYFLPWLARWLS